MVMVVEKTMKRNGDLKKLSGGGELIDKGSHLIDLSRLFLGKLDVYSSYLKTYFWNTKLEDNCFLTLKNEKNNLAFFACLINRMEK